jgi:hypothetical protein
MKPADVLTPYNRLLPKVTAPSTDYDPVFWRAIVERLGTMPMPCPYAIRDLAAAHGVSAERAFAKFWPHFHEAPWWWRQ